MFIPERAIFDMLQYFNYSVIITAEDSDTQLSTFYPALLFVLFIFIFYGMALWDRWLNLRTRELDNRPIYYRSHAHYGSVSIVSASRTVKNVYNPEQNGNGSGSLGPDPDVKSCRTHAETA